MAPHEVCSRNRNNRSAETVDCGFEHLHVAMGFVKADLNFLSVANDVSEAQNKHFAGQNTYMWSICDMANSAFV